MKRAMAALLPSALALGCATSLTTAGAGVKVYGWAGSPPAAPAQIDGCRLLETTAPFTQEESERAANDPYRKERNDAGSKGGNVLVVFSQRGQQRPGTDCPPNDKSPGCLEISQTWYRTSFGYYACAADATARLDAEASSATSQGPLFTLTFPRKTATPPPAPTAPAPAAAVPPAPAPAPAPVSVSAPAAAGSAADVEAKILAMMHEGVSVDVILAWLSTLRSRPALSADDVIAWKKAGIDERVILAVLGR